MGLECVGEVVELGQGASKYPVGTRVMCLLGGGGYAQYVAVDEGSCMKIPDSIDYATASAIPEVWLTAYMISRLLGGLKEGDVVLIHAGASGVGTSLIQLCRLFGATPIVTVGSSRKGDICKELGAAHYVDYKKTPKFSDDIKQFLSTLSPKKDGVDLVLDPVGASHAVQNLDVLALDGRWILYGTMGGPEVDKFSIGTLLRKRIQLQGTTLRSRTLDYKATLVEKFSRECLAAFESGQLKPIIDATMPMRDMQKAHELMEKNDTVGKICIQVEH
jgi:tumor protein p53-inducible protein 3